MSRNAESFLDELITWRELGFNFSARRDDYDQYESLPEWAKKTLQEHARDEREYIYALEEFENAKTHDELWNAAQRQLVREGKIQNYLRMLWGKKILEWTRTPQEAAKIMIQLNNKYALDGRDPSSYSGIFWVLGRYDRPLGASAAGVRFDPLHEFGKHRTKTSPLKNTSKNIPPKPQLQSNPCSPIGYAVSHGPGLPRFLHLTEDNA